MRASGRLYLFAAVLALTVIGFSGQRALAVGADKINARAKAMSQLCADFGGTASWNGTHMTCSGTTGTGSTDFKCDVASNKPKWCTPTKSRSVAAEVSLNVAADGLTVAPDSTALTPRARTDALSDTTLINLDGQ